MKKRFTVWAFILIAALISAVFPVPQTVRADYCDHERDTSAGFDYRNDTDDETMIYTYAKCKKCGEWYLYCYPRLHEWVQTDVGMQSCTTDGYYVVECTICGASYTHITGKAFGHSWGDWTVTRQPSCTVDGEQIRTCEECHATETQAIPAAGHQWGDWSVTRQPSCKEEGEQTRICSVCGQTETQAVPKTEHQWGEWKQTAAPSADRPGEEKRECSVCHETETRQVENSGVYAKKGDTCFEVFVAKQLLEYAGRYDGDIDRDFDDALEASLKAYQKEKGFQETGELTAESMQALAEDFTDVFGKDIPADGMLMAFDSGLLAYPVMESSYVSSGDGTHERTSVFQGASFKRGRDEWSFALPESKRIKLDPVQEPCLVANEKRTCPCGYHDDYETTVADIAFLLTEGITAVPMILGVDSQSGLYTMDIYYNAEGGYLYWDPVPGTAEYAVEISKEIEEGWETYKKLTEEASWFSVSGIPSGSYAVCIQAFDENGDAVSAPCYSSFDINEGGGLYPPKFASLGCGAVNWEDVNTAVDCIFIVQLSAFSADGKEIWKTERKTSENYADFTKELASKVDFPADTVLRARVAAKDPSGRYADSAFTETNEAKWVRPDYYRAETAVNVRSGPGKEYERVGGLSKGDIVPCYGKQTGEDGKTYVQIGYKGRIAWVDASFLTSFVPVQYKVKVDLGNGRKIDVETNPDGTIDIIDFEAKAARRENGRIGFKLEGFYLNSERWDVSDPVPENTTLQTKWAYDMSCIYIELYYESGLMERVFVRIGETYPELKEDADHIWITGEARQGHTITSGTVFKADMNGLKIYQTKLNGREIILGYYAAICPDIFRQLYVKGFPDSDSLGALKKGDKLLVEGTKAGSPVTVETPKGSVTIRNEWVKVFSYRLNRGGWIMAELLQEAIPDARYALFDPNGGTMDISQLIVRFDNEKGGYYIGVYPEARRDGYAFVGWEDDNHVIYNSQTEIVTQTVTLTAVWTDKLPYSGKKGITYSSGNGGVDYYYSLSAPPVGKIPIGTEVEIIREGSGMYYCKVYELSIMPDVWISKKDIVTEYNKLYIDRNTEYYSDHTLNYMGKKPKGLLYKGEVGYQIDQGLIAYGVIMPPYGDVRPDPMYVWVSKRQATQGISLFFDPSPGRCSYESVELRPVYYLDYDEPFVYVRNKGGQVEWLPKARCPGYDFLGWYTERIGGVPVRTGNLIETNMTVYAHYKGLYDNRILVVKEDTNTYSKSTSTGNFYDSGTIKAGMTGVAMQNSKTEKGYIEVSFNTRTEWISESALFKGEFRTVSKKDDGADVYVRKDPKAKGTKYREIQRGEVFVVVGEENGWYKIACSESGNGFAYVRKEHFK